MRWKCTYKGKPDPHSAAKVAQPSWHTFDKRVWKSGDFKLILRHHTSQRPAPMNKSTLYEVLLYHTGSTNNPNLRPSSEDMPLFAATGYNWLLLVATAKQYAEGTGSGNRHEAERIETLFKVMDPVKGEVRAVYRCPQCKALYGRRYIPHASGRGLAVDICHCIAVDADNERKAELVEERTP